MTIRINNGRLKIGIIGAGFSGTVLASTLDRFKNIPLEIFLCEKTGCFGPGEAYRTRLPYHLLNVKTKEMSAFEDDKDHFLNWLLSVSPNSPYVDPTLPLAEQYVSRALYGDYLRAILDKLNRSNNDTQLNFIAREVIDVIEMPTHALLIFKKDQPPLLVDKVIFATGNQAPTHLPFSFSSELNYIANSWEHQLFATIPREKNVLIIGTGLSMVDAVLSLYHQQHQGKIYAISRRGLLPLPHEESNAAYTISSDSLPVRLSELTKFLRTTGKTLQQAHGEWQSMMRGVRSLVPTIWQNMPLADKKQFLRHLLPYWNIHRHRIPHQTLQFLQKLAANKQFFLYAGRVLNIDNQIANILLRSKQEIKKISIGCIINCIGPTLSMTHSSLIQSLLKSGTVELDSLKLGFRLAPSGALLKGNKKSSICYALGSPTKELLWECNAVPEIRQHCLMLAKNILEI